MFLFIYGTVYFVTKIHRIGTGGMQAIRYRIRILIWNTDTDTDHVRYSRHIVLSLLLLGYRTNYIPVR